MRNTRICTLILVAGMFAGCGQKGPLVLPDAPKHKKVVAGTPAHAAATTPAPAGTPAPATAPLPAPAGEPAAQGSAPTSPPPTDAAGSPPEAPRPH